MGIREWLFGRKKVKATETTQNTSRASTKSQQVTRPPLADTKSEASSILEYLDKSKGTDELYQMLRTRSATEIEEVCRTYPIDTLRLDWPSVQNDFRNNQRFELVTVFAEILVRYDEILKTNPELRLPNTLPGQKYGEILMGRLVRFIASQQNVEIAQGLRIRLYDFALALMQAGRDRDALTCLLASRPSIKEDHEFWICACRFNIALTTKEPEDIKAALEQAEQIVSSKIKVPDKYVQGAKQMLSKLKE
jgi:hypothetical protein